MRVETVPAELHKRFRHDQSWSLERRTTLLSIMKLGDHPGLSNPPPWGGRRGGTPCRKAELIDGKFAASFRLTKEQAPESLST